MNSTGLQFPVDLTAWQRWAKRRTSRLHSVRAALSVALQGPPPAPRLYLPPKSPTTLIVMDNLSPSCKLVIHQPLAYAELDRVAILTAVSEPKLPNAGQWQSSEFLSSAQLPKSIEQVLSLGAFCELSGVVKAWTLKHDRRFMVAQHGLMTPWAPPLSDGDHLLAWSQADAEYWSAGRSSITAEVVGSQLLWQAGQRPSIELLSERPIMLGQLHGIELGRWDKLKVYAQFCRSQQAEYRPHPVEQDLWSRLGHRWLQARGVEFETSGLPIYELARPVVSIFSTGSLEAAQRGLPAWVFHPNPPEWVKDFWARYQLGRFGGPATKPWELGEVAPAELIARSAGLTG